MGVYYANLSFVEFRTMILGDTCICIHWLYGYRYTVSSFVQYVVTIAKLNLCLCTRDLVPPSNNPAPLLRIKDACQM